MTINQNENIVEFNNEINGIPEVKHVLVLDTEILCKMGIKHIRNKILKVVDSCELILCCQLTAK